jgi:hypothetical protein
MQETSNRLAGILSITCGTSKRLQRDPLSHCTDGDIDTVAASIVPARSIDR